MTPIDPTKYGLPADWHSPDPQSPAVFNLPDHELILFWCGEYDRLSRLLVTDNMTTGGAWPGSPEHAAYRNLRREVRLERDIAAARVVGLTNLYLRSMS